jgi:glycosyltransferase involved in cell wall biosynthesis
MKLIAVIPAFNEESNIKRVIAETKRYVDDIIVIDDGSSDRTSAISSEAGAVVVNHPQNMGVGSAFATGVSRALEIGADIVVTLDADGQFQSTDIPKIIEPIIEGRADLVTGSRFLDRDLTPEMIGSKRFGNRLFTWMVSQLTGQEFTDTQCGFRAYSKEALLRLTIFGRFTYTQEVLLDLIDKNMRVVEVPVKVLPRQSGKSKVVRNPVNYGIRALKIIIQAERDHHPLRFFGAISLLFIMSAVLMFAIVLANWLTTGMTSPLTSLISIGGTLLLVGVVFVILALVADMQGRSRRVQEETLYLLKRQRYS